MTALVVRLVVTAELSGTVLYQSPQLDQLEFLQWARSIADGAPIWMPNHGPGYPHLLGWLLAVFDGSLFAARAVQAIFGALACALVSLVGTRAFSPRAGIAGGFVLALQGPLVFVESGLLAEGSMILLLVLCLVALTQPRGGPLAAAVAGLLLGLATIFRATALALLPAFVLLLLLDRSRRRRVGAAAALLVAWAVVTVPVARGFGARFDTPFLLQSFGGLNLLMGNDPEGTGLPSARLGAGWDRLSGEAFRQGHVGVGERERFFAAEAWRRIRSDPAGSLAVLAKKAVWLVQAEEPRETHSFYFFRRHSRLLRWLPGFGLLLALFVCGLVLALRERRNPGVLAVLAVYVAVIAATCVLVIMSSRYRLPLVPALAPFAGLALVRGFDLLRARRWRYLGLGLAGFAAIWALGHAWTHEPSHDLSEEWALTASSLERDGRPAEAEDSYRRALRENPASAYAWTGLGRLHLQAGRLEEAEQAFRTAIGIEPGYSRAHGGLGAVHWTRGERERAVEPYREALRLAPDAPSLAHDLGRLLTELGRLEEAVAVYRQMLSFDPNDLQSLLAVARIEGARERWQEGLTAARRATDLDPRGREGWVLLSMLALHAGELATSEEALVRAERIAGGGDPEVRFARVLLHDRRGQHEIAARLLESLLTDYPGFEPARALAESRTPR